MFNFRRRWFYYTLFFKAPNNPKIYRFECRYENDRIGKNRINNIRASEDMPTDAELVDILRHGRMTELQWEKEL